ncbi:MAG: hypothetical protein GWN62_09090 [Aliifodinibius sp.]|nr:hypothetical protein [Fodinibius sp.]
MAALKTIGYIFSAILIVFGVLFILAAFGETWNLGYAITGGILVAIGFGIILLAGLFKQKTQESNTQQTTLKVDLPGDVNIERFQCQDCGAQLSMDNVKMVAGAPMVDCPYCGAAYQLTEDPKW